MTIEIYKLRRRVSTPAIVILFTFLSVVIQSAAASDKDLDVTIQEMVPMPARCGMTTEPLFYCRHDNAADHTMTLEFAAGVDGPSASLTHDYDDAKRHEFLALIRRFFIRLGIPAAALDACISGSQWQPTRQYTSSHQILCYRVELGDRVTHEVFALAAKAPMLAYTGEVAQ